MIKHNPQQLLVDCILSNKDNYYRLAYSYVRNRDDALDIVHESICKAMASSRRPEAAQDIKPWFYRIVVNTALDFLRKHRSVELLEEENLEPLNYTEDTYQDLDLQRALEELPLKYRSVIVLRYFEDLKIEDVAAILGENINTVKTRLYSALKKLRIQLEDQ